MTPELDEKKICSYAKKWKIEIISNNEQVSHNWLRYLIKIVYSNVNLMYNSVWSVKDYKSFIIFKKICHRIAPITKEMELWSPGSVYEL